MSSFASLMALSATQTKESQGAVQSALRERQRKEELRRKQQEEKEAKDREMEKQRRLKMFEDQRKEEQRQQRLIAEERARELIMQRREEEQRKSLLYGPKKAAKMASTPSSSEGGPKWPTSSSTVRETVRKRRVPDASDEESGGLPLTREELRERKLAAERRRLYSPGKRTSHSGGYHKSGRRLPGGAVDIQTSAQVPEALAGKSVKDRLTAMPNTLTKLNTNKRDTRTIDEIVQDRARAKEGKTLQGDEALVFDDWFGTKKEAPKRPVSARPSPPSALPSGANTPASSASMSAVAAHKKAPSIPRMKSVPPKTSAVAPSSATAAHRSSYPSSSRPASAPVDRHAGTSKMPTSKSHKAPLANGKHTASSTSASTKKRPRSYSPPASPPPSKRRQSLSDEEDDEGDSNLKSVIWGLFGKSRDKYVSQDVYSDDEDMEADATILEREEAMSAKIAKREEMKALEEERRHEEEKRRRKKEKERLAARG